MKFGKEQNGDHDDNIEGNCCSYDDDFDEIASAGIFEMADDCAQRGDEGYGIDEGQFYGVEKHQNEEFAIMETDASINPGTK